ncbi:MAG: M23 family metallopeptidase [Chloroflexi bacterium]|nr:M23 family metallopeptidase [Chloroflexota bacterium]
MPQDSVLLPAAPEIGSAWWSPVVKPIGGSAYTVKCGSSAHTNGASYAADVSVGVGTNVYAANDGVIEFWGWDNSGYGNLVKIKKTSNGYRHYYGHLNEINFAQPSNVTRAAYLGKSGSSGTTQAHLHFHVQSGSNQLTATGITLVGMTGFTSNQNYPGVNAACGTMGR